MLLLEFLNSDFGVTYFLLVIPPRLFQLSKVSYDVLGVNKRVIDGLFPDLDMRDTLLNRCVAYY